MLIFLFRISTIFLWHPCSSLGGDLGSEVLVLKHMSIVGGRVLMVGESRTYPPQTKPGCDFGARIRRGRDLLRQSRGMV